MFRRIWVEEGLTPRGDILVRALEIPQLDDLELRGSSSGPSEGAASSGEMNPRLQRFRRVHPTSCPCIEEWAT